MRKLVVGVGVAATVVMLLSGCDASGSTPSATPSAPASMAVGDRPTDGSIPDPPSSTLVEPTPKTEAAKLLQQSTATLNFCTGWRGVSSLFEAPAHDVSKQLGYAYAYYNLLAKIDLTATIPDLHSTRSGQLSLPADVRAAVKEERAAVYAYEVRIARAQNFVDEHLATKTQVSAYLDHVFQLLATSRSFAEADQLLETYYTSHC